MKVKKQFVMLALVILIMFTGILFATNRRENDPIGNYKFKVEIGGLGTFDLVLVKGIASETEVIEHRESSENIIRKIPGRNKFHNIILRKILTGDEVWWEWRKRIIDGIIERKAGSIILMDESSQEVMRWNFFEAWPAAYRVLPFKSNRNNVPMEELEIVYEDLQIAQ